MDITEVVEGRGAQRGPMLRDGEDTRTQVHTSGGGNLNLTLRPEVHTVGRRKPEPDPKARCEHWQCPRTTEGRMGGSERVSPERKRGSDTV